MKVILIGYPGSQRIVPASKYLTSKYLPGFDVRYVNYKGGTDCWSMFVSGYLSALTDDFIIFALDDYLLAGSNIDVLNRNSIATNHTTCVKLCNCTDEENSEYPVTTQYTIWNRNVLLWFLSQVRTPWEFEIIGSSIYKKNYAGMAYCPCLEYFTNSSISSRWEGVRLDGLKQEDLEYIKQNNLIL